MTTTVIDAQSLIDEFKKTPWITKDKLEKLIDSEIEQDGKLVDPELSMYRILFTWNESYELVCTADAFVNGRVEGSMIANTREELRSYLEDAEFSGADLEFHPIDFDIYYEDIEFSEYYVKVNNLQLREGTVLDGSSFRIEKE